MARLGSRALASSVPTMKIAILGAGITGLSSGIRLLERRHEITFFAERRTPDTTSDRAGAAFTPFHGGDIPRASRWVRESLRAFGELARTAPESGVSLGWMNVVQRDARSAFDWWRALAPECRPLTQLPASCVSGWSLFLPRIDMQRYPRWLDARANELGAQFVAAHIESCEELFDEGFDGVVNATGLGARLLCADSRVFPLRGQVLHVANDTQLDAGWIEEGAALESTYVFPFGDRLVLGGTNEPDEWLDEVEPRAIDALLERCRSLLERGGCAQTERLGRRRLAALAGLRPARGAGEITEDVRLERVELAPARTLVHVYGHGRSGVTFSWGCARDVVSLCEDGPRERGEAGRPDATTTRLS